MSGFYQRGYSNVIANENREFTKSARTCKILLNYIHKVETLKANLDEYKRICRRHLYEFGVICIGLLFTRRYHTDEGPGPTLETY